MNYFYISSDIPNPSFDVKDYIEDVPNGDYESYFKDLKYAKIYHMSKTESQESIYNNWNMVSKTESQESIYNNWNMLNSLYERNIPKEFSESVMNLLCELIQMDAKYVYHMIISINNTYSKIGFTLRKVIYMINIHFKDKMQYYYENIIYKFMEMDMMMGYRYHFTINEIILSTTLRPLPKEFYKNVLIDTNHQSLFTIVDSSNSYNITKCIHKVVELESLVRLSAKVITKSSVEEMRVLSYIILYGIKHLPDSKYAMEGILVSLKIIYNNTIINKIIETYDDKTYRSIIKRTLKAIKNKTRIDHYIWKNFITYLVSNKRHPGLTKLIPYIDFKTVGLLYDESVDEEFFLENYMEIPTSNINKVTNRWANKNGNPEIQLIFKMKG